MSEWTWVNNIIFSLQRDIVKIETELQFYINLEFNENEKEEKIKTLLADLVVKEQSLVKWGEMTNIDKDDTK